MQRFKAFVVANPWTMALALWFWAFSEIYNQAVTPEPTFWQAVITDAAIVLAVMETARWVLFRRP